MKNKQLYPTLLSILFIATVWQLISMQIGFPAIFPSVFNLIKQVFSLFGSEHFLLIVFTTILRGIIGFFLAFSLAITFATIAKFSTFWKAFFYPINLITRSIPVISFVLIAILWFSPPYLPVFIAIITMFPILYQNILTGLEQTDNKLLEMASVFGKTPYEKFVTIYIPASKSFIFDGISTAMGFGWRAIIIGEVLAQPIHGIGTAMKQTQAFINVSELIAWTVIAVGVSYFFDSIIKLIKGIHLQKRFQETNTFEIFSFKQTIDKVDINAQNIYKKFNDKSVLNSYSALFDNETVSCIKGLSGIGKTTLLKILAQVETVDSGEITFQKNNHKAFSFQDVRLLPWLTVSENIAYSIRSKHIRKQEIGSLVSFLLTKMELNGHGQKYPHELSGGQQQRVGLARALAARSAILLLDEPLNGLDNELKIRIIDFLSEWITTYQPLVVWATHEDVKLKNLKVREVYL